MMEKKKRTAAEFVAELRKNPAFVEQSLRLQQESARSFAEQQAAERPILDAIHQAGLSWVSTVWDMGGAAATHPKVLDILVNHLQQEYPEKVREGIAHAIAVPQARRFWDTLLTLFVNHQDGAVTNRTKWAIGCALAVAADSSVVDAVIAIVREPKHGNNRLAFLKFLSESPSVHAQVAFEEAGRDPQFEKEVRFLKRIRRGKWRRRPGKQSQM